MKKLILISFLITTISHLSAQNTTSRIRVNKGASLDVYFNQLDDYSNGISLGGVTGYTELGIYFNETDAGGFGIEDGWQLSIEPDGDLISVYSGESININCIDLRINGSAVPITLTGGKQIIASGPDNKDYNGVITINYDIGKTNSIDKVSNERFVVLLDFILEPKP